MSVGDASTTTTDASGPIAEGERVRVIDVLRGFALLGILVVNMAAFRAPPFGEAGEAGAGAFFAVADPAAEWLVAFGFEQKFYVLFSFLFGYGLAVQMGRAAAKGTPFVPRFLRRLSGLLLIGLAHAALLYTGDILVTYALLGVVLLLMRNAGDGVLLRAATALVALSALAYAVSGAVLATLPAGSDAAFAADLAAEAERAVEAYRGAPAEVVGQRLAEYPGTLAFALLGQGPTALAMFFVGLWAGRGRLFERADEHLLPLLRRVLLVGLVVGVPGALAWATAGALLGADFGAGFLLAGAVDFATAPFLSAAYLAAVVLLYRRQAWRRRLEFLAPVGRLALSNYLLQSLVASLVFTGYGLGLYGRVGAAAGLALSVAIFALQVPLSAWWLSRFRFGPAEWVLRSFTYGRLQPLRARPGRRKNPRDAENATTSEAGEGREASPREAAHETRRKQA